MRDTTLSDRALALRAVPHEDREACDGPCVFLLIDVSERRRQWRCEACLRYLEAPVLPDNERNYKNRIAHPRALLLDQERLF